MADAKITALTANTTPALTDIVPMVDNPGASPLTQKITIANLLNTPSATFTSPTVSGIVTLSGTTGIAFPASQTVVGDNNTLDDFEEGSFTATGGGSGR